MDSTPTKTIWTEVTDFLASRPSAEAIIAYRLPDYFQQRALVLLEKNKADELTPKEYEEMMDFVRIDNMMSLLRAKTELALKKANGE